MRAYHSDSGSEECLGTCRALCRKQRLNKLNITW